MLCYTGVLVLLALLSQGANGQKDNGREMTEQMMKYLERIILHQEQQQRVQDERMERLEQMFNETVEAQRRLQQQQVEQQVTINQTCVTASEQSLQLLNNAISDISAVHDIQYGKWLMFHLCCFRCAWHSMQHHSQ